LYKQRERKKTQEMSSKRGSEEKKQARNSAKNISILRAITVVKAKSDKYFAVLEYICFADTYTIQYTRN
jgi:hypothetical protein